MTTPLLQANRAQGGLRNSRPLAKHRGHIDIDPDLVIEIARQIPTLETDALVRLFTSTRPARR
jgi:hypothetical protein